MHPIGKAPISGDTILNGRQLHAYMKYAWQEWKADKEPAGVIQAEAGPMKPNDDRSPFRVYADHLMHTIIKEYLPQPASILDIGCGEGLYASVFKEYKGEYHGIDIFPYPQWEKVKQESAAWPLQVYFYNVPAEQQNTLDISGNFSISSSALEHVEDPVLTLKLLAEKLEPGAYGLHIVPGTWTIWTYGPHGWRRFSAEQLQQMFEAAGFEVVKIYRLGGAVSTLLHFFWITGFEQGWAFQLATFSVLPFFLYRIIRRLRFHGARTNFLTGPIYRLLLRTALSLDKHLPRMPSGYGVLVRRQP